MEGEGETEKENKKRKSLPSHFVKGLNIISRTWSTPNWKSL